MKKVILISALVLFVASFSISVGAAVVSSSPVEMEQTDDDPKVKEDKEKKSEECTKDHKKECTKDEKKECCKKGKEDSSK